MFSIKKYLQITCFILKTRLIIKINPNFLKNKISLYFTKNAEHFIFKENFIRKLQKINPLMKDSLINSDLKIPKNSIEI